MTMWTTREIAYMEEHASEGAQAVAAALGRSAESVRQAASRYGVSLRVRWHCPRCGHVVYSPLSARTGWCEACTRASRLPALRRAVEDARAEAERVRAVEREAQRLYAAKSRARKGAGR